MFNILPESRAPRTRKTGGAIASVLAHAALVAGVVSLSLGRPDTAPAGDEPAQVPTIYIVPTPPAPAPLPPGPRAPTPTDATPSRPPTHVITNVVPPELPPIDLGGARVAPEEVVIGTGGMPSVSQAGGGLGTPVGSGTVIGALEADRPPRLLGRAPEPRYPEALRTAGISGRVVLEFVVDTLGRAEPGSERVLESPHDELAESVRRALPRFRFTPGEAGGHAVRTRVQMPFDFQLSRGGR